MRQKNVALVTTLLFLFTLVLFYQNCSQDSGGGGLFNTSSINDGGVTSNNSIQVSFTNESGAPININTVRPSLDSVLGVKVESVVNTSTNQQQPNVRSVLGCIYVESAGGQNNCLSSLPTFTLPNTSGSNGCTQNWQNLDCPNQKFTRTNAPYWTNISSGVFQLQNLLEPYKDAQTGLVACNFPSQIVFYFKPNDGNPNSYISARVNFSLPERCR